MAAKKTLKKSDFIRAQPATMSAADVIAKGKAEGINIGSSLVYMVRRRSPGKAKKGASKTAPAKPPVAPITSSPSKTAAKSTASSTKAPKSKADFVRARAHLSPKEIVEDAKAEGVKFDVGYVYNVRGADKASRKKKRAAVNTTTSTPRTVNGAASSVTSATTTSSAEDLLRAIAAELGLGRAVEILAGERARVRAMLRG
jgi:hypothetical protein